MQSSLQEILASQNGIKVILSLASADGKHLPPHARELLSPPERTITVPVEDDGQQEGEQDAGENSAGASSYRLGLQLQCRCVRIDIICTLLGAPVPAKYFA
jgi:hypothetical protein